MDGTVNCAKRDDGRPVFWATATGAAGTGTGLETTVIGTTTFSEDADLAADLLATAGLGEATGVGALAALSAVFATGLETDFATVLAVGLEAATDLEADLTTGFATGFVMDFSAALATGLEDFTTDFTGFLTSGLGLAVAFTAGFAGTFFAVLTSFSDLAEGLASFFGFAAAALDLRSFPDLAFTWSLLVELARLSSTTLWASTDAFVGLLCGVSSARECTGFAIGKPISCKIETIIPLPAMILHLHNTLRDGVL